MDKMDKFKDFVYNVSDVLVTILIILIAALLISWRVSAIVHYPDKLHSEQDNYSAAQDDEDKDDQDNGKKDDKDSDKDTNDDKNSGKDSDDNSDDKDPDSSDKDDDKTDATSKSYSITVMDNESAGEIAKNLVEIGIISDTKEFLDAVKIAGAEKKLRSGTFDFPPGCTADQIVEIMTR